MIDDNLMWQLFALVSISAVLALYKLLQRSMECTDEALSIIREKDTTLRAIRDEALKEMQDDE